MQGLQGEQGARQWIEFAGRSASGNENCVLAVRQGNDGAVQANARTAGVLPRVLSATAVGGRDRRRQRHRIVPAQPARFRIASDSGRFSLVAIPARNPTDVRTRRFRQRLFLQLDFSLLGCLRMACGHDFAESSHELLDLRLRSNADAKESRHRRESPADENLARAKNVMTTDDFTTAIYFAAWAAAEDSH